jgi:DNA-binding NtrC family response regulator
MKNHILLISHSSNHIWHNCLQRAAKPWGLIDTEQPGEIFNLDLTKYALIIIEAIAQEDMEIFIGRIRAANPDVKIVVFSAAPNWEEAKKVLLAGASEYIKPSLDEDKLRRELEPILEEITKQHLYREEIDEST